MSEKTDQPGNFVTACGGTIQNENEYPSAYYQGRRVFFCLHACLRAFELNPEAFMEGKIEHPLGEE